MLGSPIGVSPKTENTENAADTANAIQIAIFRKMIENAYLNLLFKWRGEENFGVLPGVRPRRLGFCGPERAAPLHQPDLGLRFSIFGFKNSFKRFLISSKTLWQTVVGDAQKIGLERLGRSSVCCVLRAG
eukprot:TRINITY_DN3834_c0_g3_i1.p1 TRINITY_DN3834_c0_g3~~TRINITY_DN3834_c0_g3_i1.p1  ORF type:complete len:130 (-),score=6.04 TRINITY_DN3834_c0_g3_i1:829-1218(-)